MDSDVRSVTSLRKSGKASWNETENPVCGLCGLFNLFAIVGGKNENSDGYSILHMFEILFLLLPKAKHNAITKQIANIEGIQQWYTGQQAFMNIGQINWLIR